MGGYEANKLYNIDLKAVKTRRNKRLSKNMDLRMPVSGSDRWWEQEQLLRWELDFDLDLDLFAIDDALLLAPDDYLGVFHEWVSESVIV
jgi:hypothetical protein